MSARGTATTLHASATLAVVIKTIPATESAPRVAGE
jgi:hypothetical protein